MAGSTYNRENYKAAIPQLGAKMDEILDNNVIIEKKVVTLNQTVEKVDDDFQYYKNLTTGYFTAIVGDLEYLTSREAYLQNLNTDIARIGYIDADAIAAHYANLTDFNAVSGEVDDLKVGNLTIGGVTVNIYDLALAIKQSSMASETIWYKASVTTPTAPTAFDPTSDGWSMTEPVYTGDTNTHLYSCLRVVYADHTTESPHFVWSDIHLIQSWDAAKAAYSYAETANTAATGALNGLATVEDVVGTLNWIAEHGEYVPTEDTEVKSGKQYYLYESNVLPYPYEDTSKESNGITFTDNGDGTITANGTATANADFGVERQNQGTALYLDDGRPYHLSGCPEGGSTSTYYMFISHTGTGGAQLYGNDTGDGLDFEAVGNERTGVWIRIASGATVSNLTFSPNLSALPVPVENPTGNPSAQGWYELSIDEAVSNYIATHLALTEEGLFLTMDDNGYKLKLTSQGAYIVDPTGTTVAEYSDQTIIGDARFRNVFIDSDSVDIRLATEVLASFGETVLIGKSNAQRVEIENKATKFFDASGSLTAEIAQGQTTGTKFVEQNLDSGTVLDDVNGFTFDLSNVPKGDNGHGLVVDVNICEDHARIWFESWTSGQVKTLTRNNITAVFDSSANTVKLIHSGTKENVAQKEISTAGSSFTHTLAHDPASNSTAIITLRSTKYGSAWYIFRNVDLTQDVSDYYGQFRFTYSAATKTFSAVNDQGVSCYIEVDYVAEASVVGANSYIRFSIVGVVPNYTFGNRTEMDANQSLYNRGARSFASGFGMVAEYDNQAVFGQYNDNDSNNLLEIGNGTSDISRSNAFAVGLDGNVAALGTFETDETASQGFRHIADGNNQTIFPVGFYAERSDTGVKGWFGVNASGEFLDIYSVTNNYPVIRYDATNDLTKVRNVKSTQTGVAAFTHSVPSGSYAAFRAENSSNGNAVELQVGSGGTNRGIYLPGIGWMIYYDGSETRINNLATDSASGVISSGWANYTSGEGPRVYKSGKVVTFIWECKPTASKLIDASLYTVCTIPSGYRPPRQINAICQSSGTRIFEARIKPDGAVSVSRLRNTNSTSYDTATTSYWFPIHMTYVIE